MTSTLSLVRYLGAHTSQRSPVCTCNIIRGAAYHSQAPYILILGRWFNTIVPWQVGPCFAGLSLTLTLSLLVSVSVNQIRCVSPALAYSVIFVTTPR